MKTEETYVSINGVITPIDWSINPNAQGWYQYLRANSPRTIQVSIYLCKSTVTLHQLITGVGILLTL